MVITLGSRRVLGIGYGDLLEVEVGLDAEGFAWRDDEWLALFREYAEFPADLEEPRLEHGKLRFEAREQDLQVHGPRSRSASTRRTACTASCSFRAIRRDSAARMRDATVWTSVSMRRSGCSTRSADVLARRRAAGKEIPQRPRSKKKTSRRK